MLGNIDEKFTALAFERHILAERKRLNQVRTVTEIYKSIYGVMEEVHPGGNSRRSWESLYRRGSILNLVFKE